MSHLPKGNIDYRDAANNAKEKGVVVNTIFCGNYSHGIDTKWKDGALLTYGDYMAIDHNKETIYVASPYDDAILQLNIQLNGTYIPMDAMVKKKWHSKRLKMQMPKNTVKPMLWVGPYPKVPISIKTVVGIWLMLKVKQTLITINWKRKNFQKFTG